MHQRHLDDEPGHATVAAMKPLALGFGLLAMCLTVKSQDSTIPKCYDLPQKLGALKQADAAKRELTKFPIDLTKLNFSAIGQQGIQIQQDATGSDLLMADHATLARPEVQELLARSSARLVLKMEGEPDLETVKRVLSFKPKQVTVYVAIPKTMQEVQKVFGEKPDILSQWDARRLSKIANNIEGLRTAGAEVKISVKPVISKSELIRGLESAAADDFVLVVIHNEGGIAKTPNGDPIELAELNNVINKDKVKGVVLTCESIGYTREASKAEVVTNRRLRFDEIACALAVAAKAFSADTCQMSDDVLRLLSKGLSDCFEDKTTRFKLGVAVAGSGLLTATIVMVKSADSQQTSPSTNAPAKAKEAK